jgi:hypothetical protein
MAVTASSLELHPEFIQFKTRPRTAYSEPFKFLLSLFRHISAITLKSVRNAPSRLVPYDSYLTSLKAA